ncbi:hypothetical protein SAMN05216576_107281 [Ectopseudomonas chengduensis]|jgi:hypothetical protein|uniref:Uncharacterized protein n=2 Tax=Ectopseudomonas TaxID=3236654 RepID=A0A1G6Q6B6_9GAMM|nr:MULTISPECIES: hypothetical protein [Pseudomonas]ALN21724.1 hypothetical protein DW68_023880 [Pseudomonas mendocina S5.2]KER98210.1 hypothetical protein HN51_25845 [Pseudomonas mendocina]OEO24354.1 hypothetical protein AX279_16920 [Pseudomonas sp. J237]SDC87858.1 hypothetical protein SAMN05216576_107281 [Pseudomonas chengduensis]
MYRIGNLLNPLPCDQEFPDISTARDAAVEKAAKSKCTPVAIWGDDSIVVALFLAGEEFVPA